MSVDARVLEVVRSPGSAITIRSLIDPATRYLQDAWALAKDDGASAKAKSDVIPVLCRLAVEAACRDAFYAIRLTAGDPRDAVEAVWQSSPRTRARIALGLFGKDDSIDAWLNAKPWRRKALTVVTEGRARGARRLAAQRDRGRGTGRQGTRMTALDAAASVLKGQQLRGNETRIAALLARCHLERCVSAILVRKAWQVEHATMRSKLLCLHVAAPAVAEVAATAWHGLSEAVHYHAFELAPTASEVSHLLALVRRVERDSAA